MRILAFCFMALLSYGAMAQGIPGPGQGPGPGDGIDPCTATYEGSYEYSGGPLVITLRHDYVRDGSGQGVTVELNYRGRLYYGVGHCDGHLADWTLDGGWPHAVEFQWAYGTPAMRGTQWVRRQPYQNFYLSYRGT